MIKIKDLNFNEFLFSFYILLFPTIGYFYKSSLINNIITFIILGISFIFNIKRFCINKHFLIINLIIAILFFISFVLNNNMMIIERFRNYIMYGAITMLLYCNVKNDKKVLDYFSIILLFVFLLSFNEPFNNYNIYGGYMSYGLFCILPSFLCFHIQRKYMKRRVYYPFEIMSIFSMLFSNRNTILICMISIIILDCFITKNDFKKKLKYFFVILFLCTILYFLPSILSFLISKFGVNSYALRSLKKGISENSNLLSGRDLLWQYAIYELKINPIFGIGIGGYEAKYGIYCHNVILDCLLSFGLLGFILLIIVAVNIINKYKKYKHNIKFWTILLIGVLPLLFNNNYMTWKFFWIFLIYIFENNKVGGANKNE